MDNTETRALLEKYLDGNCSPEEKVWVERAYNARIPKDEVGLSKEQYTEMSANIWAHFEVNNMRIRKVKLWPRIAAAASIILVAGIGVWLYTSGPFGGRHSGEGRNPASAPYANDVKSGRNTATLTLANGEVIKLSDRKTGVVIANEKLAYNDGSVVDDVSGGRHPGEGRDLNAVANLTATTPRGGQYQITLPDGTRVWLNADSKISFPSQFTGVKRKILLKGEAYFEVAKNKNMPFIVESAGQEVEVLGTHFNINSYTDESSVKTTLLEGSVRVTALAASPNMQAGTWNSQLLKPNQQSVLNSSKKISVKDVDISEAIAWKNGVFKFDNEPLVSIMRRVARWYDITVTYDDPALKNTEYGGTVSRSENLSGVLSKLEYTGKVHFKIEGKKVIVTQ